MRILYFKHELMDMYEDILNDQEPVVICGTSYDQGRAYRLVDEATFECEVSEWEGSEFDEVHYSDMTPEEIEHYMISSNQHMYCRKKD